MARAIRRVVIQPVEGHPDACVAIATESAIKDIAELEGVLYLKESGTGRKQEYFVFFSPLYDPEEVKRDILALNDVSVPREFREQL